MGITLVEKSANLLLTIDISWYIHDKLNLDLCLIIFLKHYCIITELERIQQTKSLTETCLVKRLA